MAEHDFDVPVELPANRESSKNVSELLQLMEELSKGQEPSKYLFGQTAVLYRQCLSLNLTKLIFKDVIGNGSESEKIMWQKAVYEPICIAKVELKKPKLRKAKRFYKNYLHHLDDSIGLYKSLLARLQNTYFRPDVWPKPWLAMGVHRLLRKDTLEIDVSESQAAEKLAERCVIYLGDLYRYRAEIGDFYSRSLSCSHYKMSTRINPDDGFAHNKLGALDVGRAYELNAVYHYLRSLASRLPYDGSKENLAKRLNYNESRYLSLEKNSSPLLTLQSRFEKKKSPLKLKDLRIAVLRFLQLIYLNTQYYLGLDENTGQSDATGKMLNDVISDMDFILRFEGKRYGSKCIKLMIPKIKRFYNGLPDFCPNPETLSRVKTSSTTLLPPIILRIVLTIILSIEVLFGNQEDNEAREKKIKEVYENSKELPPLLLHTLDLLLVHSFRAIAKAVNMFSHAVLNQINLQFRDQREVVGETEECVESDEKVEEYDEDEEYSHAETEGDGIAPQESRGDEGEELSEESDSSNFGRLRGPRLRQLRSRCRMIDEDDFLSSSSDFSNDEDGEYGENDSYSDSYGSEDGHSDFDLPEEEQEEGEDEENKDEDIENDDDFETSNLVNGDSDDDSEKSEGPEFEDPTDKLSRVNLSQSTAERINNAPAQNEGIASDTDGDVGSVGENGSEESDQDYETFSDFEDGDGDTYYGPLERPRVWLRLFIASFFVDSFLAGIKLTLEWLFAVKPFLKLACSTHPVLMQEVASHLASLLNYLNPIVTIVEAEVQSEDIMKSKCHGLPIHFIHSTTTELLCHVSSQCREMLKRECERDSTHKHPPLTEDWLLRGAPTMSIPFSSVDFEAHPLKNRIEETLVRCVMLTRFGHDFAELTEGLGLKFEYHKDVDYFTAPLPSDQEKPATQWRSPKGIPEKHSYGKNRKKLPSNKSNLDPAEKMPAPMDEETMRSLAKRRLETEVANLSDSKASKNESEANSKTKKKEDLSKKLPHIVIDSYCMLSNAVFMNRLITSKTAVIVVPRKVVVHLDQMKKITAAARSATRILEERQTAGIHIQESVETPEGSIQLRLGNTTLNADGTTDEAVVTTDSGPVDFSVMYRWANIIECAIYFAEQKQKISYFKGADIEVGKTADMVNVLEFQSTLPEIENPTISVLLGTKAAPPEELKIPAEFVKIAHNSGVVFEPLHKFSRRWKPSCPKKE